MSNDKDSKTIQREKIIFKKCSWENDVHKQKNEAGTLCTKINFKWIKDLNVRPKNIKCLEENIGCMLSDNNLNKILSDLSLQTRETKAKFNK